MGRRGSRALSVLPLVLLGLGCRPASAPVPAVPSMPPANAPVGAASRPPAADRPRISADAAGPVRLGMTAEAVRNLPGVNVSQVDLQLEGTPSPALRIARDNRLLLLAELVDGKVWRTRVLSTDYRTAQGAGLGTSAAQLQKLYGPGRLSTEEGNTCATFAKAPGLSFCFAPGTGPRVKSWNDVVKRGLSVTAILVFGQSD